MQSEDTTRVSRPNTANK